MKQNLKAKSQKGRNLLVLILSSKSNKCSEGSKTITCNQASIPSHSQWCSLTGFLLVFFILAAKPKNWASCILWKSEWKTSKQTKLRCFLVSEQREDCWWVKWLMNMWLMLVLIPVIWSSKWVWLQKAGLQLMWPLTSLSTIRMMWHSWMSESTILNVIKLWLISKCNSLGLLSTYLFLISLLISTMSSMSRSLMSIYLRELLWRELYNLFWLNLLLTSRLSSNGMNGVARWLWNLKTSFFRPTWYHRWILTWLNAITSWNYTSTMLALLSTMKYPR